MGYTAHYIHIPKANESDRPASLQDACALYRSASGWLSAEFSELNPRFDRLAKELSAELSRPVLSLAYYDDDVFHLRLFSEHGGAVTIEKNADTPTRAKGVSQLKALFDLSTDEETRLRKILRCPGFSQQLDLLSEFFGVMLLPALMPEQAAAFQKGDALYRAYLAQRASEPKIKQAKKTLVQSFPGKIAPVSSPPRELPTGEVLITSVLENGAWSHNALMPYSFRNGQLVKVWDAPINRHFHCYTPKVWDEPDIHNIGSAWYGCDAGSKAVPGGCILLLESWDGTFSLKTFLPGITDLPSLDPLIQSGEILFICGSSTEKDQLILFRISVDGAVQATALLGSQHDRAMHLALRDGRLYAVVNAQKGESSRLMIFDPLQLSLLAQIQTAPNVSPSPSYRFNESGTRLYCACILKNQIIAFDLKNMCCIFSQPVTGEFLSLEDIDARGRVYAYNGSRIFVYDADLVPLRACSCSNRKESLFHLAIEGEDAYLCTTTNDSCMWGAPQKLELYLPEQDTNGRTLLRRVEQRIISGGKYGPWEYETYFYSKPVEHPPAGYTLLSAYENGLQAWGIPERGEIHVWHLDQ